MVWNVASLFIIREKNLKYLRDLETAIVRIAKPKYNDQKGRVHDEHFLERLLRKSVKLKSRRLHEKRRKKDAELQELEYQIDKIKKVIDRD